jgi:hypothetical protein
MRIYNIVRAFKAWSALEALVCPAVSPGFHGLPENSHTKSCLSVTLALFRVNEQPVCKKQRHATFCLSGGTPRGNTVMRPAGLCSENTSNGQKTTNHTPYKTTTQNNNKHKNICCHPLSNNTTPRHMFWMSVIRTPPLSKRLSSILSPMPGFKGNLCMWTLDPVPRFTPLLQLPDSSVMPTTFCSSQSLLSAVSASTKSSPKYMFECSKKELLGKALSTAWFGFCLVRRLCQMFAPRFVLKHTHSHSQQFSHRFGPTIPTPL